MTVFSTICRICNTEDNHPKFVGREMMFGTRDEFEYFQCISCGCLQITDIPKNLDKYYPSEYSPHSIPKLDHKNKNLLVRILQKQRCRTALFGKYYKINTLLKLIVDLPAALYSRPNEVSSVGRTVLTAGLKDFDEPILDVGCGIFSHWLASLDELGFTQLQGVDPLIPSNQSQGHVRITKGELRDIPGKFSLITLHHSLEHIINQEEMMIQIAEHLNPDGVCLIRIPIVSSRVWEEYKTNWIEFDPPRHLYLHSLESLNFIAKKAGLEVYETQYDTSAFEFYGSEMYARNISWYDEDSPLTNPNSKLFSKEEMINFEKLADIVNQSGHAGRAAFYLRKARA
ncbi:hypothetical protein A1353_13165 [Methylomonas methanica]|uniref:Methyltransferase type 11 n=1 Tax=Methylomonas methanica TaxID=421 RepID=A0A177MGE3_METMH|nr:class I SAM-dependent methyltransferase [Methylomonas methanica]OAI04692.1 hypothetical protein A1353_13165 [Methylomonas methanica]